MTLLDNTLSLQHTLSGERLLALENFLSQGFPTKKDEEYRYTPLREITEKSYQLPDAFPAHLTDEEITRLMVDTSFNRAVFINGKFSARHSFLDGLDIEFLPISALEQHPETAAIASLHIGSLSAQQSALVTLNRALYQEGAIIRVKKNSRAANTLQLLYLTAGHTSPVMNQWRNLFIVEDGAEMEVIESNHNLGSHAVYSNTVTEIFVGKNAKADWHKLQNDTQDSYLTDSTFARQEQDSRCTVNTFSFGGKLVRNNLDFIHQGENINSYMNGITVIGGEQLVDHHTAVHHNRPNCESYQNYKGIFNDRARGVFNGKVFVDKIAQKTNAYQQNNNVLLSEGAGIDTKPQLEIFADDVKCSHGCTVGQLNEDALFYLRARGISKKEAQALLLYAFANDAMQNIDIEPLRDSVSRLLAKKLDVNIDF